MQWGGEVILGEKQDKFGAAESGMNFHCADPAEKGSSSVQWPKAVAVWCGSQGTSCKREARRCKCTAFTSTLHGWDAQLSQQII